MRTYLVAGLAVVGLTVSGCTGGADQQLGSGDDYSVLGALAELPASGGEEVLIQTADLTTASEISGLTRPSSFDDDGINWLLYLSGVVQDGDAAPVFVPFASAFNVQHAVSGDEFADLLGWSVLDVDAFVEQSLPPDTFAVVSGDFDDSTLPPELIDLEGGVVSLGEGEDFQVDMADRNAASPLGRPIRLAHQDGRIAVAPATPPVADWLSGPEQTLADDSRLAALATALDDADVVSALLRTGVFDVGAALGIQATPDLIERTQDFLPAVRFDAVGVGWAVEDDDPVMTVAYHLGSDSAAEGAVAEFERAFQEGLSLRTLLPLSDQFEAVEVQASGSVVVVTLHANDPSGPARLARMLQDQDVPFVHQ